MRPRRLNLSQVYLQSVRLFDIIVIFLKTSEIVSFCSHKTATFQTSNNYKFFSKKKKIIIKSIKVLNSHKLINFYFGSITYRLKFFRGLQTRRHKIFYRYKIVFTQKKKYIYEPKKYFSL